MRVIAGTFRGRRLAVPQGNRLVRPTTDRVKESVFSILRERVVDADFLDLCAGTGSMGIEALSRGREARHIFGPRSAVYCNYRTKSQRLWSHD